VSEKGSDHGAPLGSQSSENRNGFLCHDYLAWACDGKILAETKSVLCHVDLKKKKNSSRACAEVSFF